MLTSCDFFTQAVVQELRSVTTQDKHTLVATLWPDSCGSHGTFDECAASSILEHIASTLDDVRHYKHDFAANNFDDTFKIIQTLKQRLTVPYGDIVRELAGKFPGAETEAIRRSVELSVRMWLTVNTHTSDIQVGPISAGDIPIDWAQDVSLNELFRRRFGRCVQTHGQKESARLHHAFTGVYLVNTCGMRLRWTDDIAAHLVFDPRRNKLTIYRHKACLNSHLMKQQDCPIPRDVLEEVLDTLDLLFPPFDVATQHLLDKEGQQSLYTLGCRRSNRSLDLGYYQYFGEKLEYLAEAFDSPRTWRQLALDRRNKLEWSAFWVTVMVAILTVISIPCNIIQATYSVKGYYVAVAQGNAAVATER